MKATFPPAYCWANSRNQALAVGWSYITAEEAAMLSILRRYEWFEEAMDKLRVRKLEQQMGGTETEEV
ncbi:uncharacterized protein IUM83_10600 [Phytophthora cinnamomi]|uniref:uncharacterized protein n=1 Tax=Phytophthora cinnamomi TaxID=4785 RepID=UPI00355A84DE|nr:hypothetical protein IUM83_10600 [Phytophthora cinnamomi]